jgi:hypothetical protein
VGKFRLQERRRFRTRTIGANKWSGSTRTAKRRAKTKEQDEEMRKAIQEADERREAKELADESEGPEE